MGTKTIFKKRYIAMSVVIIALPLLLLILPDKKSIKEVNASNLLAELDDDTRFLTVDYIADKIISKDPSIQLIDVREPAEFEKFSLPGAINIPLSKILDKEENKLIYEDILNQEVKTNVFYSNGSIYANQAWMLCRRMDFKNNYVLNGGLNKWAETIILPEKPIITASQKDFEIYEFRKAASAFFTGGNSVTQTTTEPKNITKSPEKKEKKKGSGGGC